MKNFNDMVTFYKRITNDFSEENEELGVSLIQDEIKAIANRRNWPFVESKAELAVHTGNIIHLPDNFRKLKVAYTEINGIKYPIENIVSREEWLARFSNNSIESDHVQYMYIDKASGTIDTFPKANKNITIYYTKKVPDYTMTTGAVEGVIIWAHPGQTSIIGQDTNWGLDIIGRQIKIDGAWYTVAIRISSTTIVLETAYAGIQIDTATPYELGGTKTIMPEGYEFVPVYKAIEIYFSSEKPNDAKATRYNNLYAEKYTDMERTFNSTSISPVLNDREEIIENPNNYIYA